MFVSRKHDAYGLLVVCLRFFMLSWGSYIWRVWSYIVLWKVYTSSSSIRTDEH